MSETFDKLAEGPGLADFLPDVSHGFTAYAGATLEKNATQSDEYSVIEALQTVKDPEIPVNIYDLGLMSCCRRVAGAGSGGCCSC